MKVIERGEPKRIRCDKCNSLLEYEQSDVGKHYAKNPYSDSCYDYIKCPICYNRVKVNN